MKSYYLFSFEISVNKNHELFPKTLDVNNETDINEYINNGVKNAISSQSYTVLNDFVLSVNMLVDSLRYPLDYDAFTIYSKFYHLLTSNEYSRNQSILNFINSYDFTSIYYNYAILFYENGNVDKYLYYLSLADNEYSKKKNCLEGNFIKGLIKEHLNPWIDVRYIFSQYNNYETINGHFSQPEKVLELFNIQISRELFESLIEDFKSEVLLQFIDIIENLRGMEIYFNFKELFNDNGKYKNIKLTRYTGELTWLFEIYLKDKLKHTFPAENFSDPLDKTIKEFLKRINYKYEQKYSKMQNDLFNNYSDKDLVNTEGLNELLKIISNNEEIEIDNYIRYLLALKIFRNYYSHYMDRHTNLGISYSENLILRITIYSAFIITKKLFDDDLNYNLKED